MKVYCKVGYVFRVVLSNAQPVQQATTKVETALTLGAGMAITDVKEGIHGLKALNSTSRALGSAAKTRGKVFWFGGDVAKNAAMSFAKANGLKTHEMTTRGRIINTVGPYLPRSISTLIWDGLSRNFQGVIWEYKCISECF